MTSTPVSLNDESLNGSWVDINSASQIHSPMDDDSAEFLVPPYSVHAESVQNLGLISFQVERFLQEAQRSSQQNLPQTLGAVAGTSGGGGGGLDEKGAACGDAISLDDNSGIYLSDTDISDVDFLDGQSIVDKLRLHRRRQQQQQQQQQKHQQQQLLKRTANQSNNNDLNEGQVQQESKLGADYLLDQLSDSISLLSRASVTLASEVGFDQVPMCNDSVWLWGWTKEPEYFTGQEWKLDAKTNRNDNNHLTRPKQRYRASQSSVNNRSILTGKMVSWLFLTNILSIIIGAGLTYSILMRNTASI